VFKNMVYNAHGCRRMSGAIPPLPQYTYMAWCSAKAQGQLYLYLYLGTVTVDLYYEV